jgi:tRNA nucleotidyltransferase (CCA-adding enzyme)
MLTADPAELRRRLDALPAAPPLRCVLAGYEGDVYLVGGAVRDLARGEVPRELDLLVEADPACLAGALAEAGPEAVRAHPRFGTATVTAGGFDYDVVRARTEHYDRPGALPSVSPADAETDLQRRDFTVNAIALALTGTRSGSLLAAAGALDDLRSETLRILHPKSFRDDPTRLLRLARYAGRLGFGIEPETLAQARIAIAAGALDTVSAERIGAELRLLAAETDPVRAFAAVSALGLDAALAPGFGLDDPGAARRALDVLPGDGRPGVVVLAAATLGMTARDRDARLARWAFPASQRAAIAAAAQHAPDLAAALARADKPSQIAAAARNADPEAVALAAGLSGDPARSHAGAVSAARAWLHELRGIELEITGADLLAAGVPAGVAVGTGLRAALAARLDGRAQGRAAELAEALRVASA